MKKWLLWSLLMGSLSGQANDGSFYASGNTLVPLKETTIRLKKEVLSLTRKEDWMQVDIYFEFFNPGPEKELTVGFVTPPAVGDVTEAEESHPQIRDFMVMVGNRLLSYKITRMKETGFKTDDKIADGNDFVYHFPVKFSNGVTVIRHCYQYRGGSSVEAIAEFYYRLSTGTTWANGAIEDFELNIDMGNDSYFAVPARFEKAMADWTVAGIGRMSKSAQRYNPLGEEDGGAELKMVYLRQGLLQLRAIKFKPRNDLSIIIFQLHNEISLWCEHSEKNDFTGLIQWGGEDSAKVFVSKLSDNELRLYRNLDYARMGYDFKDAALKAAFSKYIWYIPDPLRKMENTPDYYIDKEIQKLLLEEEKKRKIKTEGS